MSLGRVLLVLAVLAAGWWVVQSQHLLGPTTPEGERAAPIGRARTAAAASDQSTERTEAATGVLDSQASGGNAVTENMTPEQVRALLGPPDSMELETTQTGGTVQKWIYRQAGKTVVFENGVVARVE